MLSTPYTNIASNINTNIQSMPDLKNIRALKGVRGCWWNTFWLCNSEHSVSYSGKLALVMTSLHWMAWFKSFSHSLSDFPEVIHRKIKPTSPPQHKPQGSNQELLVLCQPDKDICQREQSWLWKEQVIFPLSQVICKHRHGCKKISLKHDSVC